MNLIYLHIGDYSQATARLSPEQDGIYFRLLMEYYKTEKPPVDDLDKLAFLMGCNTKKLKTELKFILELFFVLDPEKKCWFHKRVEKEISGFRHDCVQKRHAILSRHWEKVNPGVKKPTYEEYVDNPSRYYDDVTGRIRVVTGRKELVLESYPDGSTGTPSPNYPPGTSTQEPVTSNHGTPPVVPEGTSSLEAAAETIYQLYPRKEKKKKGVGAIMKALKGGKVTELELLEAVGAYAAAVETWPAEERRFIPLPASWFNGGCWTDDRANWARTALPEKKEKGGAGATASPAVVQVVEAPPGWKTAMRDLWGFNWQDFYGAFETMLPADQRQVRVWLEENGPGAFVCPVPADWRELWAKEFPELECPETWAEVCAFERAAIVNRPK